MALIDRYFAGKTAAISGAGDGIGRALAIRLNRAGCHLWLSDINATTLAETCEQLDEQRGQVVSRTVDCGQRDDIFHWAEAVANDTRTWTPCLITLASATALVSPIPPKTTLSG